MKSLLTIALTVSTLVMTLTGADVPTPPPVYGPFQPVKKSAPAAVAPARPQWLVLQSEGICAGSYCTTVWHIQWSTNLTNWFTALHITAYDGYNDLHLAVPVSTNGTRFYRAWREGVGPGWRDPNPPRLVTLKAWPAN